MEKALQDAHIIELMNRVMSFAGLTRHVNTLAEALHVSSRTSAIVAVTEAILKHQLPGIVPTPMLQAEHVSNLDIAVAGLAVHLKHDLSHISGAELARGSVPTLRQLLEVLEPLLVEQSAASDQYQSSVSASIHPLPTVFPTSQANHAAASSPTRYGPPTSPCAASPERSFGHHTPPWYAASHSVVLPVGMQGSPSCPLTTILVPAAALHVVVPWGVPCTVLSSPMMNSTQACATQPHVHNHSATEPTARSQLDIYPTPPLHQVPAPASSEATSGCTSQPGQHVDGQVSPPQLGVSQGCAVTTPDVHLPGHDERTGPDSSSVHSQQQQQTPPSPQASTIHCAAAEHAPPAGCESGSQGGDGASWQDDGASSGMAHALQAEVQPTGPFEYIGRLMKRVATGQIDQALLRFHALACKPTDTEQNKAQSSRPERRCRKQMDQKQGGDGPQVARSQRCRDSTTSPRSTKSSKVHAHIQAIQQVYKTTLQQPTLSKHAAGFRCVLKLAGALQLPCHPGSSEGDFIRTRTRSNRPQTGHRKAG